MPFTFALTTETAKFSAEEEVCSQQLNTLLYHFTNSLKDQLTSTVGLQIDYLNELLYVCNVNTFSNLTDVASVVALNLKDGSVEWNSDLTKLGTKGAPKLVNDVSPPDSEGNVYATESLQGLIFKISSSGKASLFVNNGTLISPQDALLLGANGIDIVSYLEEEYLLVGVSGLTPETSYLVRVPISNPKKMSIVQITDGDSVYSLDGLYYDQVAQNLYAVSNAANLVYKLASSDGWETASVIASIAPKCPGYPGSTVVHLDNNPNHAGSAYILCPDSFSQRGPYQIENIEFYDVSGSYFYYYYFYTTNSASSVAYVFALAACIIALAL